MASGLWTIAELRRGAQGGSEGETFYWKAATSMPTPAGGARAAPRMGWTFSGEQRQVRTQYPGATTPSVQVLGPAHKPFTLDGVFDDRYNFAGYAVGEQRRLEEMLKRGNLCRISFQDQVFLGLFTEWSFPYKRDWQIGYSLTFDVHSRAEEYTLADRSPELSPSPAVAFDALDVATQAMLDVAALAPRTLMGAPASVPGVAQQALASVVDARLARMTASVDQLALTLDNRDLTPPTNPIDGFTRLATQFREVQGVAYGVLVDLASVTSDAELAVQTAMAVLDFETWSRSMRFMARAAMGRAVAGDRACGQRAEPDAVRIYRPQQGESLYAIARKFLGSPHAWRLIYDRNHLSSVALTGDEVLIIPEKGSA